MQFGSAASGGTRHLCLRCTLPLHKILIFNESLASVCAQSRIAAGLLQGGMEKTSPSAGRLVEAARSARAQSAFDIPGHPPVADRAISYVSTDLAVPKNPTLAPATVSRGT